jgi:hypothetical protein
MTPSARDWTIFWNMISRFMRRDAERQKRHDLLSLFDCIGKKLNQKKNGDYEG